MRTILDNAQKLRLRDLIINGARHYQKYLVGKNFLIVCEDGSKNEVCFIQNDFKHLTGLYSDFNDLDFFNHCLHSTIDTGNISTEQKYDWSTLRRKCKGIENIEKLIYADTQKTLLVNGLNTHTKIYPIAIKDLSSNICIGFVSDICKARSMRKASSSNDFESEKTIKAIFSRNNDSSKYNELIYISSVLGVYKKDNKLIEKLEEPVQSKFLELISKHK